jgi:hypothetical protein
VSDDVTGCIEGKFHPCIAATLHHIQLLEPPFRAILYTEHTDVFRLLLAASLSASAPEAPTRPEIRNNVRFVFLLSY